MVWWMRTVISKYIQILSAQSAASGIWLPIHHAILWKLLIKSIIHPATLFIYGNYLLTLITLTLILYLWCCKDQSLKFYTSTWAPRSRGLWKTSPNTTSRDVIEICLANYAKLLNVTLLAEAGLCRAETELWPECHDLWQLTSAPVVHW